MPTIYPTLQAAHPQMLGILNRERHMSCKISILEYMLDDETDNLIERLYCTEDVTYRGNGNWEVTHVEGSTTNVNECYFGEPRIDAVNRSVTLVRWGPVSEEDRCTTKQAYTDYLWTKIEQTGSLLDGLQQELGNWTK